MVKKVLQQLRSPRAEKLFAEMYGREAQLIARQMQRHENLINEYVRKFGDREIRLISTPGRTEIGGNHTDHNHGRVLAAAINLDSVAVVSRSGDNVATLFSSAFSEPFKADLNDLSVREEERQTTTSLIRGIAAGLKEQGYKIGGFNAVLTSNVLIGSGLSSSASVEVLIATIFNSLYNNSEISKKRMAIVSQYAENQYFGKPCGLMDQMTAAIGGIVTIDFADPSAPLVRKVDCDFKKSGYCLVVVNTGESHADLTENYAAIPAEMKSVAENLGGKVGRDISFPQLLDNIKKLRPRVGDRAILRMAHFLAENERVVEQVAALEQGEFYRFLQLVTKSGNSSFKWLQNGFTADDPHSQGVALALMITEYYLQKLDKKAACRVHGGGFAGTIQAFLPREKVNGYVELIDGVFGDGSALVLEVRPYGTLDVTSILEA